MAIQLPKLVKFADTLHNSWAGEVRQSLERLVARVLIGAQPVVVAGSEDLTLTNGATTKLLHGLNRKLRGYLITDLRGATATGRIVRLTSSGDVAANDSKDLWLDVQGHGADITVRILVF